MKLTGATLQDCAVCHARQVKLIWIEGRGWCCPVCKTDVNGGKN